MEHLKRLPQRDIDRNTRIYDILSHAGVEDGWYRPNKTFNFKQMIQIAEFAGKPITGASILDVGCGTGDFSAFVEKLGATDYTGVDIYEPALKKARRKYPNRTFIRTDILSDTNLKPFDYVFCSGAFSVKLPETDNYAFLEAMVRRMHELATTGVVFNFLTDKTIPDSSDLVFYYNPEKVVTICKRIAPKASIKTVIAQMEVPIPPADWQAHVYVY